VWKTILGVGLVGAAALLIIAAWDAIVVARLVATGVHVNGVVSAVSASVARSDTWSETGASGSETTIGTARVRFVDDAGRAHVVAAAATIGSAAKGDAALVCYPAEHPDDGRAFLGWPWTWSALVAGAAALTGGFAFAVYAFGRWVDAMRRARKSKQPPGLSPERL
jgi:hypothetical protein